MLGEFGIGVLSGVPLPVKLIGFDARRVSSGRVLLDWQTAQEQNNKDFDIQKAPPTAGFFIGVAWKMLILVYAIIKGQGSFYKANNIFHTG